MHPDTARYACPRCHAVLVKRAAQYQENLDGGPYAWVVTLACESCDKQFHAWWLMRLVPTEHGVDCNPEWRSFGEDAPILIDDTA